MNGRNTLYTLTRSRMDRLRIERLPTHCGAASKINATANQDDNVIHQLNPRA